MHPFARILRPKRFDDVWGHKDSIYTLKKVLHPLKHHTFLLSGTAGVGKTTFGRLIGQTLCCPQPERPCGNCPVCLEIHEGRHVDFIEIDAAAKTKVEEIRDIVQSSYSAPLESPYKIFLFDEAHMLSGHSFNALLKAFEEPPEHVVYILATTESHKILPTVRSRCLNFHFETPSLETIKDFLKDVAQKQHILFDDAAVSALAYRAQGSYRDALNLLQHAQILGDGDLRSDLVRHFLCVQDEHYWKSFFEAFFDCNLVKIQELTERSLAYTPVLVFQSIMLDVSVNYGFNLEQKSELYLILAETYKMSSTHPKLAEFFYMLLIKAAVRFYQKKKIS